jgi:pimeloyl-ACP methyl ester carboxylesterase
MLNRVVPLLFLLLLMLLRIEHAVSAASCSDEERRLVHDGVPVSEKYLVVMIHGWRGNPILTWSKFPDLLYSSLGDHYDIATFGYPTGFNEESPPLQMLAEALGDWLQRKSGCGNNADYKEYIFVAHSFGGLLVKSYIVSELSLGRKVKSKLVFLIGVPNFGDDWSKIAIKIPFIPKAQLRQLEDRAFLYDLQYRYMTHTGLLRVRDVNPSVIQQLETISIVGQSDREGDGVVNTISARFLFPNSKIVFNKDHVTLVKPDEASDKVLGIVQDEIRRLISDSKRERLSKGTFPHNDFQVIWKPRHIARSVAQNTKAIIFVGDKFRQLEQRIKQEPMANLIETTIISGAILDHFYDEQKLLDKVLELPPKSTYLVCGGGYDIEGFDLCLKVVTLLLEKGRASEFTVRKVLFVSPPLSVQDLTDQHLLWLTVQVGFGQALENLSIPSVEAMQYWSDAIKTSDVLKEEVLKATELQAKWYKHVTKGGDPRLPEENRKRIDAVAVLATEDLKGKDKQEIIEGRYGASGMYDRIHILDGNTRDMLSPFSDYTTLHPFIVDEFLKD